MDFALVARLDDVDALASRACRLCDFLRCGLEPWERWIEQYGDQRWVPHQLAQQLHALCVHFREEDVDAGGRTLLAQMSVRQAACRPHWFGQFYYCGKTVALLFAAIDLLLRAATQGSFRGEGRIGWRASQQKRAAYDRYRSIATDATRAGCRSMSALRQIADIQKAHLVIAITRASQPARDQQSSDGRGSPPDPKTKATARACLPARCRRRGCPCFGPPRCAPNVAPYADLSFWAVGTVALMPFCLALSLFNHSISFGAVCVR